jgi:hypothetical protein
MTAPSSPQPLGGGLVHPGAVLRRGDVVQRPAGPHTPFVHAFLRHLEAVGFDGAPRVEGTGRSPDGPVELLSFVPGDVGVPPYPAWVADDEVLLSVARLQRRLHEAAAGFVPPPGAVPGVPYLPPGAEGTLVCHNDLCVENVVVRDGRAAAFIDFDYAAPVDRRFDIAVAARHWVPLWSPDHLDPTRAGVDQRARLRAFCDVHELTADDRAAVVTLAERFLEQALRAVRERAEAGIGGFPTLWRNGYEAANTAARTWLAAVGP